MSRHDNSKCPVFICNSAKWLPKESNHTKGPAIVENNIIKGVIFKDCEFKSITFNNCKFINCSFVKGDIDHCIFKTANLMA